MTAAAEVPGDRRFTALFHHTSDIAYVVDADSRILDLNPAAERLLGYRRDDVLGRCILDFIVPEHREAVACLPARLERVGEYRTEVQLVSQSGERYTLEAKTIPVRREDGGLEFHGIARDVTRRREAEQRVRAALDASNDFVAAVSHQLRTPLTVIKWSLELAAETPDLPGEVRELIAGSRDSAEELIRVFSDLLNFSRLESGEGPLASEPVDLAALTWKTVRDLRWLASAKRHQITVGAAGRDALVQSDPVPLGQIMQNLLGNAIKYTPAGGQISIGVFGDADSVAWSIADSGPGVPAGLRNRMFERFVRAPVGPGDDTEGTGLGLYIVKRLVDRLGGRVWVESEPGQGAAFGVRIPRRRAQSSRATDQAA